MEGILLHGSTGGVELDQNHYELPILLWIGTYWVENKVGFDFGSFQKGLDFGTISQERTHK